MSRPTRGSERSVRLGVVADDLTGANATGVRLAGLGMEVWSAVTAGQAPRLEGVAQAGVMVTESRAIPAREAARRVAEAAAELVSAGATSFGKRIDSTIRGNLGSELEAMITALDEAEQPHLALVVPAYPSSGRVVAGGYLLVHGLPVEETAAGSDPSAPVRFSRVCQVLREQTGFKMHELGLDEVLRGPDAVQTTLAGATRKGIRVVVADATTDAHIETLAEAAVRLESPILSVDPGPFTGALTRARLKVAGHSVPTAVDAGGRGGRGSAREGGKEQPYVVGVVGSVTPLSIHQVARAKALGAIQPVPLPVERLVAGGEEGLDPARLRQVAAEALEQALACLNRGEVPLLVTAAAEEPLLPAETAASVAAAVGRLVVVLAEGAARQGTPLGGLYLSGGDITVAACKALNSPILRLEAEVEPLVAFARLAGGPYAGLALVTKGGLVGDDEALVRALRYLLEHADGPGTDRQGASGWAAPGNTPMRWV